MKPLTLTQLRADLYRIVDDAIVTGRTVHIVRNGCHVRIVPDEVKSKISRLKVRKEAIVGDPEDIVHLDWSKDWSAGKDL